MTQPLRMTAAELVAMQQTPKQGRVRGAERTVSADGTKHDSKLESRWWAQLQLLQAAGQITDLKRQVNIPLVPGGVPILTPKGRQMHYRADFTWTDRDGAPVVADAKGHKTETYIMKRAILAAQGVTIRELT
ncbi:DUF1064 domain-containing protein [uncultured Paracoccus sp.]|uniref:DUF1064 domain-containing protein n=1 Tax=uncultured Paracoccus sp. TaxID=189685 RepID=UPI0030DB14C2|tara:strand:+ start:5092 stop:5487 length:396 start_codon:yes stop_codon:yes gene_type:complete